MTRVVLLSVVLVLLLYSCTLAVGLYQQDSVHWPNWERMPGGTAFSIEQRKAEKGPINQHQGIVGCQNAYVGNINGQSVIGQITRKAVQQLQNPVDIAIIEQEQSFSMLIFQMAGIIGTGHTGGIQHFGVHQHQAASLLVGQSTQTCSIGVAQFSHVVGAPGSIAFARGKVVASTRQMQCVN